MGGVFNTVNLALYHYAGNNPVKYLDPDGNYFLLDDLVLAVYLKLTNKLDSSIFDLTWASFKDCYSSKESFIAHGKLLYAMYSNLTTSSAQINDKLEATLKIDIANRKIKLGIQTRKEKEDIPTNDELSKDIDSMLQKHKGDENAI